MHFEAGALSHHLGGRLLGNDGELEGVSIDSRTVQPGNLFVPLQAERDGHEFVSGAVTAGAAGYLSEVGIIDGAETALAIGVDNTTASLRAIGQLARGRLDGPVVGVTGSVGKTSMKDLINAACRSSRITYASKDSFNNELGVPLTLANAPDDAQVVVVEMGARGLGHIAELCEIAEPTIGVVTTVALAHSELFGTISNVAEAKSELIQSLPPSGVAVLNADDELVAAMASRTTASVMTYGLDEGEVRATDVTLDKQLRPSFTLVTPSGSVEVKLAVAGAHMALNAAGAMATALAVGVDLTDAAGGLASATLSPWRMDVVEGPSGVLVINDAYNANPTSMRAALQALASVPAAARIAVLGPMGELGDEGPGEHRAISYEAIEADIRVIAVDAPDYGPAALHVAGQSQVLSVLGELGPGIVVLVKGSRVAGLERLAAALLASEG